MTGSIARRPWMRLALSLALAASTVVIGGANRASAAPSTLTVAIEGPGAVTSDPAGISCPPTCSATFEGSVTLTAVAGDASAIAGWSGCAPTVGAETPTTCTVSVSAPKTVVAIFTEPVAFSVLDDINVGPGGSAVSGPTVRSGSLYYSPVDDRDLYVSTGQPGAGAVVHESPPLEEGGLLHGLVPFADHAVLFIGWDGTEPPNFGPRLFVSDGTAAGTHPVRPFGSTTPCAGYYWLGPGTGRYDEAGGLASAPGGAVFAGLPYTDAAAAGAGGCSVGIPSYYGSPAPGPRNPYFIADDLTVTSLVRGFATTDARGMAYDLQLFAAVGNTVYADLSDCGLSCTEGKQGRELHSLDLSSPGSSWQLVDGGISPGPASTQNFRSFESADGHLYFGATHGGETIIQGLYATDGTEIRAIAEVDQTDPGGISEGLVRSGDVYYYRPHSTLDADGTDLVRYSWGSDSSATIATCGESAADDEFGATEWSRMAALGQSVYFLCGESGGDAPSRLDDGLYRVDAGGTTPSVVWEPDPVGPVTCEDYYGNDIDLYWTPLIEYMAVFEGALYLLAQDLDALGPSPSCDQGADRDLWVYTGSGDPTVLRFNPEGPSRAYRLRAWADELIVWANDGVHGSEPWTGGVVPSARLTLAVSGPGAVTAAPYAGTPLSGIDACTGACSGAFPSGSTAVLTATEDVGATFVGWSSNCTSIDPDSFGAPRCLVRMSSARTVGAVFAGTGDALAVGASASADVGPGGLLPYSVVVGNLTPGSISDISLGVVLSAGTVDLTLTPWCQAAVPGPGYTCALAPLAGSTARALRIFATAPLTGTVVATFAVSSPTATDAYPDNDEAEATTGVVTPDLVGLTLVSFPSRASSGDLLSYRLNVRNLGATQASNLVLHVGYDHLGMDSAVFASPCTSDVTAAPGYSGSASCALGNLVAGSEQFVAVEAPAPQAQTDIPLVANFWVTYGGTPGLTSDDIAGPVSTLVVAPNTGEQLTQESETPLDASQTLTTSAGGGATPSDPSGIDVSLPTGFAGLFSSTEVVEEDPVAPLGIQGGMVSIADTQSGTLAAPSPGTFACGFSEYPAACLRFDVTIDEALGDSDLVYLLTFRFDRSAFVSGTSGRALALRRLKFFHMPDGAMDYSVIPACRGIRLSTYTTYTGTGPCILGKRVDRPTGDYLFVIVTPENGAWKPGR